MGNLFSAIETSTRMKTSLNLNRHETWQGHNIADFVDPDIMEKLEALEKEEEARERAGFYDSEESEEDESYAEIKDLANKIRHKKAIMKADQFLDNTRKPVLD